MNTRQYKTGFTLLEALLAVMLIGLAVAGLAASSGAFTQYNAAGVDLSTAEFLIEEIRELTAPLPAVDPTSGTAAFGAESGEIAVGNYDDLDDFHNKSFSPPIDVSRTAMPEFSAFTQQVTVQNVSTANLTQAVANHSTDLYRVTVTITKNGQTISSASWIRARY
jgi:type II secretory pathway pseudopilin PulG